MATGDDIAIGSPILLSAMLDELGESIEKGLVCFDMVESKNNEEKLGMPRSSIAMRRCLMQDFRRYMCSCPCMPCGTIGRMYRSTLINHFLQCIYTSISVKISLESELIWASFKKVRYPV